MAGKWWEKSSAEHLIRSQKTKRKLYIQKRISAACDRQILASTPEEKENARIWVNLWASASQYHASV
ncbi:hypothetical protein [Oceanospirillum sediminis]|uniref:Uncharacterized protein n=1 Tax=Oceanospirillum sediminis TaxID=2760088 RepID=A0A839IT38_9GAMM|nr:hypothetical protein [Oceanospirillum sediminis]MBB1488623.1 hypothetical protein [Oceanospirillum sediminis]